MGQALKFDISRASKCRDNYLTMNGGESKVKKGQVSSADEVA